MNESKNVKSSKKILFSIPDFYFNFALNSTLLEIMDMEPDKFYDDIKIDSIYGSFPNCIWNSGKAVFGLPADHDNIVKTIFAFNRYGISIRYTFTNSLITEELVKDCYCNSILENTSKMVPGVSNACIINSSTLAKYIQENYPEFDLVWSSTLNVKDIDTVNRMSEDRPTILYYGMNNTTAIKELKHPENIEILVSEACIENCPERVKHYENISKFQMYQPSEQFNCPYGCEQYYYYDKLVKREHFVSIDDIRNIYLPLGINKFILSGRQDNIINIIENYVNYFVKPEFKDDIRNKLLINSIMLMH